MQEFAPGIPNKKIKSDPPEDLFSDRWTLNVQEHKADKAGLHYDVRLNPPGSSKAIS